MNTIKNYLDNMFAALPKNAQMSELKNNILSTMEDKYNALKAQGKSENEAIGIVISEFGNIDELISELGIEINNDKSLVPMVTQLETEKYLRAKKSLGLFVGIGVFLCILSPAALILLNGLTDDNFIGNGMSHNMKSALGLIPLFVLVAIAVGLFIYSGLNFEKYQYMEKGVNLPASVKDYLKLNYEEFTPTFVLTLVLGIGLCILSPIALIVMNAYNDQSTVYGIVILLFMVAIAVFLFIYYGCIRESYSHLLNIEEHATKMKEEDKVIAAVASIVWPLATIIFLFCGFVYGLWHIAWIVFPIVGILFGSFSAAYSIIKGKNE
ncbi:MAG: hypothetical protein K0S47_2285 [Herbinix sp.]|jgi:hypothetical protein|nr:hypothetical protein [Herbinix sp.]